MRLWRACAGKGENMPDAEVHIELQCSVCGDSLCDTVHVGTTGYYGTVLWKLAPCPCCMAANRVAGFNEGLEKGERDADTKE